jgi:hypothetical protein
MGDRGESAGAMTMRPHLTYDVRNGVIVGTAAGQRFLLPAQRGADLGSWTKVQGLDLEWELVEYGATGPSGMTTRLRRKARILPPPHDDCSHCVTGSTVAFVDDGDTGFIIHGWPPCNGRRCIVLNHGWEKLLRALVSEGGGGSIRVV